MPRKEYGPAHEARYIAQRLIDLFHPQLAGARIEYVFVSEPPKQMGRELAGRARKVTGLMAHLATPGSEGEPESFFCIEITKPKWDLRPLKWKVALVDHELKHCDYEDELDDLITVGHDEEDFDDIVERHGVWNEGLENFINKLMKGDERKRRMIQQLIVELEAELKENDLEVRKHEARAKTKRAPERISLRRDAH
jgi:hypothetical protein